MIEVNGTDEQRAAMFAALSKAQGSVKPATKDRQGQIGTQTYKYANLEAVAEAVDRSLVENGLAIIFSPGVFSEGVIGFSAVITHELGGMFTSDMSFPVDLTYPKNGAPFYSAQNVGKVLTYARRQAKVSILDMVTEDDDAQQDRGSGQNRSQNSRQGGYSDSPDNEPPRASYKASEGFTRYAEAYAEPTADGAMDAFEAGKRAAENTNPATVEALIKNTGFPHKGILGAYLKEKDMLTSYRAEDIAAWLSDNAGASGEELLFAAAAYGAEKLDGEFRDKAEAYAKANPS